MDAVALTAQLRGLYAETHIPPLAEDEFTVGMFARVNGCNSGTASRLIQRAVDEGKIKYVGDRIHERRRASAYRIVKPA